MKITSGVLVVSFFVSVSWANSGEDNRLVELINQFTQKSAELDPFTAPALQIKGFDAQLGRFPSADFFMKKNELFLQTKKKLGRIDTTKLSPESLIDFQVFAGATETSLLSDLHEGHRYMNFSHMGNRLMDFIKQADPDEGTFPFETMRNYLDFAERMKQFPKYTQNLIQFEREGIAKGYKHSCYVVKNGAVFLKPAIEQDIEQNPFWQPLLSISKNISQTQKQRLETIYRELIRNQIYNAYTQAIDFVENEYSKKCLEQTGFSGLPQGDVLYKDLLRSEADTEIEPKIIHQMGLQEVERIKQKFIQIQTEMGFVGTLKEFMDFMRNDPANYFETKEQLVSRFEELRNLTMPLLPMIFEDVPKTPFTIETKDEPGSAYARFPTKLNPVGAIVLEVASLKTFPKFTTATLFLHEGMPGHVLSGSVQFENQNLSDYRRSQFYSNAFDEGWALYAESLGYEMGLYVDPYSHFGHLADDMLRAVRLVVDTGLHSSDWTRDQAVQYMDGLVPYQLSDTENEIDRYLAIPAQAVSYKIGQFKIFELRGKAENQLGTCFDLRKFNSAIVKDGIMSLAVLENKINRWIELQRQQCKK